MDALDFTPEQTAKLFAEADRRRRYLERLHARLIECRFPADDPYRRAVRTSLIGARAEVLALVEQWPKGEYRRFMRRARDWPRV